MAVASIQYAYGITLNISLDDMFETQLRLKELEDKVEMVHFKQTQHTAVLEHNSAVIDALEKNRTSTELESAERILELNEIEEVFSKVNDRGEQKDL